MAATRGIDECLRGGLVDVPSTMLRYPPSISSSVGTRSFCECARIWQSEYDLVTRNQPLYGRGTFSRDQQSRLPASQCSHDHPPSRGCPHNGARSVHMRGRTSLPMVRDGHAICPGYNPGRCGRARATFATADSCLANMPRTLVVPTRLSLPTCPSTRWCRISTYSVRQLCQHHA